MSKRALSGCKCLGLPLSHRRFPRSSEIRWYQVKYKDPPAAMVRPWCPQQQFRLCPLRAGHQALTKSRSLSANNTQKSPRYGTTTHLTDADSHAQCHQLRHQVVTAPLQAGTAMRLTCLRQSHKHLWAWCDALDVLKKTQIEHREAALTTQDARTVLHRPQG